MACLFPINLKRGDYGDIVPCGKCINCIQKKRADWSFRLLQEQKNSILSTFLTLTYNEENIPKRSERSIYKKDQSQKYIPNKSELQRYFKRVRVKEKGLKYYAVAEYGCKLGRPHYHAIVFNCDNSTLVREWRNVETGDALGFVTTDQVTEASIHYVTGYIIDKMGDVQENGKIKNTWSIDDIRPFALMSKGLGKIYLKHNTKFHKKNFTKITIKEGGIKQQLPRYLVEKIFNENERKELAINLVEEIKRKKISLEEEKQRLDYKIEKIKFTKKLKTL
ncbi:MAG: replication initiator protein [Microvirus sp.]|nr:MAG: replication initiator protein [Microvirus sp.]